MSATVRIIDTCGAPFTVPEGHFTVHLRWCNLPKGHDGDHACEES